MPKKKWSRSIEEDLGKEMVNRTWGNLRDMKQREISYKDFNKIVGRTLRFSNSEAEQILNVLRLNGRVEVTQRRIRMRK